MTSMEITLWIIIAHSAIGVLCMIVSIVRRNTKGFLQGLVILFTPPVGALYFLGSLVTQLFISKDKGLQLDDNNFEKTKRNRAERPDVELESQAVPLEEVLLVSSDAVKRSHLLMQLKKDHIDNYDVIRKALDSDDPETSHYAASALTSAKANFENAIREMDGRYIQNSKDGALIRAYADYVLDFLKSGILDTLEEKKYSYVYVNILINVEHPESILTEYDYANLVDRAIFLEEYKMAQEWAEKGHAAQVSESSFLNLLKVYYYTNQAELFFQKMAELKRSDVTLSEEGLPLVRFFASAGKGMVRKST